MVKLSPHLKKAHLNYELDSSLINPLSKPDCEIVGLIIEILKIKGESGLAGILNEWKKTSDSSVVDSLIDYKDHCKESEKSSDEPTIDFFEYEGFVFKVFGIVCFKKGKIFEDNRPWWTVHINPGENPIQLAWMQDTIIKFPSEEMRDNSFESLKQKLSMFSKVRFL